MKKDSTQPVAKNEPIRKPQQPKADSSESKDNKPDEKSGIDSSRFPLDFGLVKNKS